MPHSPRNLLHRSLFLALPLWALSGPAMAQSVSELLEESDGRFDAHGFQLAPYDGDPRDLLVLVRPGKMHLWDWYAGALYEYADQPLVFYPTDSDQPLPVLDNLMALNLSGGVNVHKAVRLDLGVPFYMASLGPEEEANDAGVGDMRLGATIGLIQPDEEDGGFGLGLIPYVNLPTGNEEDFLGNPGVGGGLKVGATYEVGGFTATGNAGAQFNPEIELENLTNSDGIFVGAGLGYLIGDTTGLNLEAHITPPFKASDVKGSALPGEALLHLRHRTESGVHLAVGGASAIAPGAGAANWRAFAGLGFSKIGKDAPKDLDGDGLPNKLDTCVDQPETKNSYKDEDGCPDDLAHVKIVVKKDGERYAGANLGVTAPDGTKTVHTTADEPVKFDVVPGGKFEAIASVGSCIGGSGSVDANEGENKLVIDLGVVKKAKVVYEVVDEAGAAVPGATVRLGSEKNPECAPKEKEELPASGKGSQTVGAGDFVLIAAAPDYAPVRQQITVEDGKDQVVKIVMKKARTKLSATKIEILDMVYFETGKAVIKPESFELLNEVATVLLNNPHVKKIEVSGHTDDRGNDAANLKLSDDRAKSVKEYLIGRGVQAERLEAKGYGESKPLEPNKTEAGRSKNRRVEFNILEQVLDGGVVPVKKDEGGGPPKIESQGSESAPPKIESGDKK
jgi:outer membrane protein OmpA-like peptidoglycan-associated protein